MRRRDPLAGSISAAAALAGDRGAPDVTCESPVFEPILADPTVVRTLNGTVYACGTEDNWRDGEGS